MTISAKEWTKYIAALRKIDDAAADKMASYIYTHDTSTPAGARALIDFASGVSTKYGEAAAALACEMYDAVGMLSGVNLPPAVPAETAGYREVAKTVTGTMKSGNPDLISSAVSRLVRRTGADTVLNNAARDGAEFAWIPSGDTCAFCLTLASRGWQRQSRKAMKGGHAEHIHANCDCAYAVRFDKSGGVAGYDPDAYLKAYEEAEGKTPQEKINAMRRAKYAANKDKINAQKRAAYALRAERKVRTGSSAAFIDKTDKLLRGALASPRVDINPKSVTLDDIMYKINGRSVKLDPSKAEIDAARMMSEHTGRRATMMPKISGRVQGVSAPDFILGDGEKWDLKELRGQSRDAIRNAIKDCEPQAHRFVIEIGGYKRPEADAIAQAERVFTAYNTTFVEELVITKNNKIIKAFVKNQ